MIGAQAQIGFGGGCHWCTEAVFQSLRGVASVAQGFISSTPPNDSFSEAVVVRYDTNAIDLKVLVNIHIHTHSSTSNHRLRYKYRSAIYCFSDCQSQAATGVLDALQAGKNEKIVTEVLPFIAFKESSKQFTNYYRKDPERPFCQRYIEPKIELLRNQYAEFQSSTSFFVASNDQ